MTGPQDAYDSPLSALRNHVEDLAVALAIWQARDDTRADAHARRCASDAVDAIDAMLQALYAIRARLISEIRASDDATAMRAAKLLAERADAMTSSSDQASPGPSGPGDTEDRSTEGTPAQRERES